MCPPHLPICHLIAVSHLFLVVLSRIYIYIERERGRKKERDRERERERERKKDSNIYKYIM
jgi:hypothetical protein